MRDTTYPAGTNYLAGAGTITVIGGQLIFDTSTVITLMVTGANLIVSGVPTTDPAVAGALWANSGVLTLSAG